MVGKNEEKEASLALVLSVKGEETQSAKMRRRSFDYAQDDRHGVPCPYIRVHRRLSAARYSFGGSTGELRIEN
jgi:hypothetical protein